MTSGFKNSSRVDLDNIFSIRAGTDPSTNVTGYVTSDGLDFASRYYPIQSGMTPLASTGFNTLVSGVSTDLCNVFAPQPVWNTVGTGVVTGTAIHSICAVDASNIYVAGLFTNIGDVAATNVAKWDGSTWSSLGFNVSYQNNSVATNITAIPGSNVFVSYSLRNTGTGNDEPYISMYNGSSWTNLTGVISAITASRYVYDMVLLDTNTLFVCGNQFSTTYGLAKYNVSQPAWTQIGPGLIGAGFIVSLTSIAKISSTQIIVGGNLTTAGSIPFNGIGLYNNTNSTWSVFIASFTFGLINSISVVSPTVVFVGASGLFRINDAGDGWINTNATNGLSSNVVRSVYAVNSTNVYFVGSFNTTPYVSVAKWTGSLTSLANGIPANTALVVAGTGTRNVYFGGTFTSVNNLSSSLSAARIAKWA